MPQDALGVGDEAHDHGEGAVRLRRVLEREAARVDALLNLEFVLLRPHQAVAGDG
jgi:hypothetical protein